MWRRDRKSKRELAAVQGERAGPPFPGPLRRHQENRRDKFNPWTLLSIGGGILVVVGDLIAVSGSGPGWITFLGLGLIAGEFQPIARFMDRAEVKLRALVRWVVGAWTTSSAAVKASICLAILLNIATLGYEPYCLFFSGSNFLTTLQ